MVSEAQRAAVNKYDDAYMAYQTVKVRKSLLDCFKAVCEQKGERVNSVLREAMEQYVYNYIVGIPVVPTVETKEDEDE